MERNKRQYDKKVDTGHHLEDLARSFIWYNSLPGESWHEITGTNGRYYLSNQGRVLSLCNDGYMLRAVQTKDNGYQYIDFSINGKRKREYIHILVAREFIPNPEAKKEVHHNNRVRADNRADNLLWLTRAEHRALHRQLEQQAKAEAEARPDK